MQVLTLPAKRGPRWLTEAFSLFRKKPVMLSFLALGYWLSMAVVLAIPWVGQALSFILIPAFSVSLMNACRQIDRTGDMLPQALFSGLHRNLQTLLTLGTIYLLLMLLVLAFSTLFDDGMLFRLFVLDEKPPLELLIRNGVSETWARIGTDASLSDIAQAINDSGAGVLANVVEGPEGTQLAFANLKAADNIALRISFPRTLTFSSQISVVLLIPVILAFWFAPVLAAWHDMSAGKSLFFSLVACLRNWRSFLLYTLALVAIGVLVSALLVMFFPTRKAIMMSLVMMGMIFLPTLYASFYISYRDIFSGRQNV